jgi:ferredoxin
MCIANTPTGPIQNVPPAPIDVRQAIKAAYRALRKRGYFCRSCFWCCSSCAVAAIPEGRGDKFVFYHRQDAGDIDECGGCYLGWAGDGAEIAAAMRQAGLAVEWDGDQHARIWVCSPERAGK